MKYTIYEDPITHRFGHLPLPSRFVDGDRLLPLVERWFESHEAAVDALHELLAGEEVGSAAADDTAVQTSAVPQPIDPPHRSVWSKH